MEYYLRRWGNPVLRERCAEVEDFSDASHLEELISAMYRIKGQYGGIGIAAPQVGTRGEWCSPRSLAGRRSSSTQR